MLAEYVFDGQLSKEKNVSLVSSVTVVLLVVDIFGRCSMFGEGRFFVRSLTKDLAVPRIKDFRKPRTT